ncbi:MAG: hypothetical protein ABIG89_03175 [Candidatus Woesearchaeota archaeon]
MKIKKTAKIIRFSKKSQMSIEYLITVSILLTLFIITAIVSVNKSNDTIKIHMTQTAFDKIINTASAVNQMHTSSYKIIKTRFVAGSELIDTDVNKLFAISYSIFGNDAMITKIIGFHITTVNLTDLGSYETLKIEKTGQDRITIRKI